MRITSGLTLRTRRAVLAAGGAALVGCASLGGIALSVANAQSSSPTTIAMSGNATYVGSLDGAQLKEQEAKFITTLASKLGVTADKLQQALKDTQQEVGPSPMPMLLGVGKDGAGIAGTAISITSDVASAAKVIGISEDQLRTERAGKSLTDVAKAHNVDPQKVASAIRSARETDMSQAAQSGKLPAEVANTMKSHLDMEINMLMTVVRPAAGSFGEAGAPGLRIVLKNAP